MDSKSKTDEGIRIIEYPSIPKRIRIHMHYSSMVPVTAFFCLAVVLILALAWAKEFCVSFVLHFELWVGFYNDSGAWALVYGEFLTNLSYCIFSVGFIVLLMVRYGCYDEACNNRQSKNVSAICAIGEDEFKQFLHS